MRKYNYFSTLLSVTFFIFLLSCGGSGKKTAVKEIRIDGSSTVYPVTEAIAEEYRNVNPDVIVNIGVSGSGGGFKKFGRNETDICNASRAIKQSEIDACKETGITWKHFTVGYDGIAIVVNKDNDFIDNITMEELKKIWEPAAQKNVKYWSDIREGLPQEEIHLFGPGTASGTFDFFTETVVGEQGASRGDYTASEDDHVLVTGAAQDKYGLAFFGYAYYEENKDKLKVLSLDNIKPSLETVKDQTYELARPLYIYVNEKSYEEEHIKNFVKFYLETVPKIIKDVGYMPLSDELYKQEQSKL